jgi:hypothetical protein
MQGEQSQRPVQQLHITVTVKKSVVLASVLAFFFGPLGMLYSTVVGAIVMFFVHLIVGLMTFGFGVFLTWPLGVIWAAVAAKSENGALVPGGATDVTASEDPLQARAPWDTPASLVSPAHAGPEFRPCPFCAEPIRPQAKLCRFCRSDVHAVVETITPAVATIPRGPWTCPACGEGLEGQFLECWSCGTVRGGQAA